jgi:hypothetical protein
VLYDYLSALNEVIIPDKLDSLSPIDLDSQPNNKANTSQDLSQKTIPDTQEDIYLQDSQDPYEDYTDHFINWHGYGLF